MDSQEVDGPHFRISAVIDEPQSKLAYQDLFQNSYVRSTKGVNQEPQSKLA